MLYLYAVISACITALVIFPLKYVMSRLGIVDHPERVTRKHHKSSTPLGGGIAIYLGLLLPTLYLLWDGTIVSADIPAKTTLGVLLGGAILVIGGLIDDKYHLRARYQIIFPVLAASVALIGGVGSHGITSPFGGTFSLGSLQYSFGSLGTLVLLADAVTFIWLLGLMYTTKFLDGLDGLVTGIVLIGALVIVIITGQSQWAQPEVAALASVFAGACAGFLLWNYHPAKIFLGEGGSLLTGFVLASLAALAGGKIAIAALVLGIPIIDVGRVLIRRAQRGQPVFFGDREHLHLQLVDSGLSERQSVLLLYSISLLLGATVIFLQGKEQLIAQFCILVLLLLIGVWFTRKEKINL